MKRLEKGNLVYHKKFGQGIVRCVLKLGNQVTVQFENETTCRYTKREDLFVKGDKVTFKMGRGCNFASHDVRDFIAYHPGNASFNYVVSEPGYKKTRAVKDIRHVAETKPDVYTYEFDFAEAERRMCERTFSDRVNESAQAGKDLREFISYRVNESFADMYGGEAEGFFSPFPFIEESARMCRDGNGNVIRDRRKVLCAFPGTYKRSTDPELLFNYKPKDRRKESVCMNPWMRYGRDRRKFGYDRREEQLMFNGKAQRHDDPKHDPKYTSMMKSLERIHRESELIEANIKFSHRQTILKDEGLM